MISSSPSDPSTKNTSTLFSDRFQSTEDTAETQQSAAVDPEASEERRHGMDHSKFLMGNSTQSLFPPLHLCNRAACSVLYVLSIWPLWPLFPCLLCIDFVTWTALMSLPSSVLVCLFLLQLCAMCLFHCLSFPLLHRPVVIINVMCCILFLLYFRLPIDNWLRTTAGN